MTNPKTVIKGLMTSRNMTREEAIKSFIGQGVVEHYAVAIVDQIEKEIAEEYGHGLEVLG